MKRIDRDVKMEITEILRAEMNKVEPLENYSQWLMGLAIKKNNTRDGKVSYTVRTLVKTNQSDYVDGMDIEFTEVDGQIFMDSYYYQNDPIIMGSPTKHSLAWLLELNKKIANLEQIDPHKEELYLGRLRYILGEYFFETLGENNSPDNHIRKIEDLYQDLLQETLLTKVSIEGEEVSPGDYELQVITNNREYNLSPKARFTKEDIIEEIRSKIIKYRVNGHGDKDKSFETTKEMI